MFGGFSLPAQPRTFRTRVFLFLWLLPLRLSGKEELISNWFAVFVVHFIKVGMPSRS
jgi:hypothetical protein